MDEEENKKKRRSRRRREDEADLFGDEGRERRPPEAAGRQVYPPTTPPQEGRPAPSAPVPQPGAAAPPPAPEMEKPPEAPVPPEPAAPEEAAGGQAPTPPPAEGGYPPPPEYYGAGYYWPQYGWYPPSYPPPGYGYGPGYPPQPPGAGYPAEYGVAPPYPPDQTGQIPLVQPAPVHPPAPPPAQFPFPPEPPLAYEIMGEEEEFKELARDEEKHWRIDFKWVFGIITAILLFAALTCAGFYSVTSPGGARDVLVPLIEGATQVKQYVEENYRDLQSRARRSQTARIYIPDIGVEVALESETVASLSSDELADKVIGGIERQIYTRGYEGNLPMKRAQGVGEDRGKAVCETILALINKNNHRTLLWTLALLGSLAFVFSMLFLLFFCRGWGKAAGVGLAIIAAALPASLLIRLGTEFFWNAEAGLFRGAMYQAFQDAGALMLMYYDIALGAGALVLLVGVIGGAVSRRSKKRVPPFLDLKRQEQPLAGEPPLQEEAEAPEGFISPPPPPP